MTSLLFPRIAASHGVSRDLRWTGKFLLKIESRSHKARDRYRRVRATTGDDSGTTGGQVDRFFMFSLHLRSRLGRRLIHARRMLLKGLGNGASILMTRNFRRNGDQIVCCASGEEGWVRADPCSRQRMARVASRPLKDGHLDIIKSIDSLRENDVPRICLDVAGRGFTVWPFFRACECMFLVTAFVFYEKERTVVYERRV